MAGRLTDDEITRAKHLLAPLKEPLDLGFPEMSKEDAILCVRYLTGTSMRTAMMLVAGNRGQVIDDIDPPVDATFEN